MGLWRREGEREREELTLLTASRRASLPVATFNAFFCKYCTSDNRLIFFFICASYSDSVLGGYKDLYWFGRKNVPTYSLLQLMLPSLVCSRGYKQTREGEGPKSLVERVSPIELSVYCRAPKLRRVRCVLVHRPFVGCPTSPFIDKGEDAGYIGERDEERKASGVATSSISFTRIPSAL